MDDDGEIRKIRRWDQKREMPSVIFVTHPAAPARVDDGVGRFDLMLCLPAAVVPVAFRVG